MSGGQPEHETADRDYQTLGKQYIDQHVEVVSLDQRPLVIYPENADQMINSICPDADFNIIILGENVYLSLNIDEVDVYPNVNRLYLDIMDITHSQVDYELSQVSMFIFNKLKDIMNPGSSS